ncbi:MAG: ATPase [Oscillospiraceae bacterium]|nr:ATPase [Oscillospiraceae bacterium]
MSIEKLELLRIKAPIEKLDGILEKCCESACFHIVPFDEKGGFQKLKEENRYKAPLKSCAQLANQLGIKLEYVDSDNLELDSAEEMKLWVDKAKSNADKLTSELNEAKDKLSEHTQALTQMNHLLSLNIDLMKIFSLKHMTIRVGKLPCENLEKLKRYSEKPFVFIHYDKDSNYYWSAYWVPVSEKDEIDSIFESLFFERIYVPDFLTGTPAEEKKQLENEIELLKIKVDELNSRVSEFKEKISDTLKMLFVRLKMNESNFALRENAAVKDGIAKLEGFIPVAKKEYFKACFEDESKIELEFLPPDSERDTIIPVKLKNGAFSRPFAMFVEMYGLPSYSGFNPTFFVALLYTLLFGMMFGDLGQGLLIALVGMIMHKKTKNAFSSILIRIGFSSAFFGLVFGSVFGFEEALNPFYKMLGFEEKPIEATENTMLILFAAIGIGVAIILLSMLLNVFVNLKKRDFTQSIFGNNGIVGIVFYAALLYGIVMTIGFSRNVFTPVFILLLMVVPLVLMFFREPLGALMEGKKLEKVPVGDFIASNFFEVFEFFLGYATNTLSFVRVGGFVLSHAGMMSVVMLLSEMASGGANIVIIIIGNIFVTCLEGLIVGIQVLRLQFYEFFSRFYEGNGVAFDPIKVNFSTNVE